MIVLFELSCQIYTPLNQVKLFQYLKEHEAYLKKYILWMKTIHYPDKIRFHLVTIAPMTLFTQQSTSKLRSALYFRYSIVIPRFIPRANTAQS